MSSVAMPVVAGCREALASLAPLFAWPDEHFAARLDDASAELTGSDGRAARPFAEFAAAIRLLDLSGREITYTTTFDLAPSCSPYLGVHLFGDENRDRGRLMLGLRASYTAAGHSLSGELPDHIALVLSFATHFPEDEWRDLLELILQPALAKMEQCLAGTANPYRHLVSAARRLTRTALEEEGNA